jgi:hypothetical protein
LGHLQESALIKKFLERKRARKIAREILQHTPTILADHEKRIRHLERENFYSVLNHIVTAGLIAYAFHRLRKMEIR